MPLSLNHIPENEVVHSTLPGTSIGSAAEQGERDSRPGRYLMTKLFYPLYATGSVPEPVVTDNIFSSEMMKDWWEEDWGRSALCGEDESPDPSVLKARLKETLREFGISDIAPRSFFCTQYTRRATPGTQRSPGTRRRRPASQSPSSGTGTGRVTYPRKFDDLCEAICEKDKRLPVPAPGSASTVYLWKARLKLAQRNTRGSSRHDTRTESDTVLLAITLRSFTESQLTQSPDSSEAGSTGQITTTQLETVDARLPVRDGRTGRSRARARSNTTIGGTIRPDSANESYTFVMDIDGNYDLDTREAIEVSGAHFP